MKNSNEMPSSPPDQGCLADGTEDERLQKLTEIARLLLDEERLQLLGQLSRQLHTLDGLEETLSLKRATILRHLLALQQGGLLILVHRQDGDGYQLDRKGLQQLKRALFADQRRAQPQTSTEKILAAFRKGDQLTQLPVNRAKLHVVLEWLAQDFEIGQTYREADVNEVLQRHHVDFATLRRYLVDYGYMVRDHGIYRRLESNPHPPEG